jgi:hypothetical protein
MARNERRVTEAEWLRCDNALAMLEFFRGKASDRKFRLFACACCRLIWALLPAQCNCDLVAAVEDHPDGSFDDPELHAALVASSARERDFAQDQGYWAVKYLGRSYYKLSPCDSACTVAVKVAERRASKEHPTLPAAAKWQPLREALPDPGLVRCIFGNPLRPPPPLDPSWLAWYDRSVVRLAQLIYDDRRFQDLPVLADALEEAGCDSEDILSHLRGPGPHGRGCWVLDLVLAKG